MPLAQAPWVVDEEEPHPTRIDKHVKKDRDRELFADLLTTK